MPVMSSPTYHKYDVIDYMSIDPEYGSIDDMKNLVNKAHEEEITVIVDFVMNHSSSKNEWFLKACDYLRNLPDDQQINLNDCPYAGYYHFSKEQLSQSYYKVPGCDWYYEGSFWSEMPDLNYNSEELRKEFESIASYWINDIGIDGFRMDAVMHFEENDISYNTEVMSWIYDYCKSLNPDFYMVSEVWSSEDTIAKYYQSNTDSFFNFDAADAEGRIVKTALGKMSAEKFVSYLAKYEEDYSSSYEGYIDAPFITNHDMGRVCNSLKSEEDALKFAGGLLLSMDGNPFVYYGEEIGMKSKGNKDENKRLPMLWDYDSANKEVKECKDNTKGPDDSDPDIYSSFDGVLQQIDDPLSILNYYKKALNIRNAFPEIARGRIVIDEKLTKDNLAVITKRWESDEIVIVYNNSPTEELSLNVLGTDYDSMSIVAYLTVDNSKIKREGDTIILPKRSIVYLKNE